MELFRVITMLVSPSPLRTSLVSLTACCTPVLIPLLVKGSESGRPCLKCIEARLAKWTEKD